MCDQQRLSPACAYAQTDQSLCLSLNYYMSVKLLIELNLVFLSLTGGCTGSSESTLVKMAHCWKSHVTVQIFLKAVGNVSGYRCVSDCRSWCPEFDHSPVSLKSYHYGNLGLVTYSGVKVTFSSCSISSFNHR